MENIVPLVLATVVLVAIPGPSVAIIVAKSIQQGFRAGITAALGTTTGVAAQLLLTVFCVAVIIESAAPALAVINRFSQRLTGGFLVGAGIGLGLSRRAF